MSFQWTGSMCRWVVGIVLAALGLLPRQSVAQQQWPSPGVSQAGFHQGMLPGPPDPSQWHGTGQQGASSPEMMYHLLPEDRSAIYDYDSPLDLAVRETFARSWFRLEYMHMDVSGPGNVLLGAPMTGISGFPQNNGVLVANVSPSDPFFITDSRSTRINVLGQVPTLNNVGQDDQNGIRGTFGIPFVEGTFEADVWALEDFEFNIARPPINLSVDGTSANTFPLIAVTSLTSNGAVVNNSLIAYNQGYFAQLRTHIFGAEVNWVKNPVTPNQHVVMSPIYGFRYIRIADRTQISGSDIPDEINNPTVVLNHRIDSESNNNIFGPHFGFRAEADFGKVTLGVEPKLLIGLNRIEDSVATQQLFTVTEANRLEEVNRNRFAPALDVSTYVKVQLTPQFSFRVGYDLLWMEGISRSFRSIRYDAPASPTEPPNVGHRKDLTSLFMGGLVIGGEYVFR